MHSFIGLIKKEMLISRFWYITFLIVITIFFIAGGIFAKRVGEPSMVLPMFIMFLPIFIVFIPGTVYSLLKVEARTQLWLYNPQSSVQLLLAKLTTAVIFQIITQIYFLLSSFVMVKWIQNESISTLPPFKAMFSTSVSLLAIGIYFSFWVFFLWTIYHSLGKFPALKNFRWLAIVFVLFLFRLFEILLAKVGIWKTSFLQVTTPVEATFGFDYVAGQGWRVLYTEIPLPIMPIILYSIMGILLFLAACKLLDKKVEV